MAVENSDFGQFTSLIARAGIVDPNYPVKGCVVWLPDGFQFKEYVFSQIEKEVKQAKSVWGDISPAGGIGRTK